MNNENESLDDFIHDPDTVGFVVRQNEYFNQFIKDRPEIKATQILSGRYLIAYINRKYMDKLIEDLGSGAVSSFPLVLGLMDRENLEAAGIIQVQEQPFLDLKGSGVLIGFVDTVLLV